MKLNWKVRFKNKAWLASFLSLIIGFLFSMMRLFEIYPSFSENQIVTIVNQVLTFLGLIGVLIDPTTEGFGDSQRAMNYEEPWKDEVPYGEDDDQ